MTSAAISGGSRFLDPAEAGEGGGDGLYTPRHLRAVVLPPELQRALDEAFAPIPRRLMAAPIASVVAAPPERMAPAVGESVPSRRALAEPTWMPGSPAAPVGLRQAVVDAVEPVEVDLPDPDPEPEPEPEPQPEPMPEPEPEPPARAHLALVPEPAAVTVGPPEPTPLPAPEPPAVVAEAQPAFVPSGFPHPAEYVARHAAGGAATPSAWLRN